MIPGRPKRPRPRRRPTPPPTPFSRYISPSLPGKKPDLLPSWRCSVDRSIGPALQVTIYKRDWAINTAVIAARQRRSEMDFMLRRCLGTTSPGGRASRQEGVGEGRGGRKIRQCQMPQTNKFCRTKAENALWPSSFGFDFDTKSPVAAGAAGRGRAMSE